MIAIKSPVVHAQGAARAFAWKDSGRKGLPRDDSKALTPHHKHMGALPAHEARFERS